MNATRARTPGWLAPTLTVAAIIVAWQLLTSGGLVRPDQFPTAAAVAESLAHALVGPELWASVWSTLLAWFLGLLIGATVALVVGPLLAASDFASMSAAPLIEAFKAIPAVAILPLVILSLGSTLTMKVFLISFGVFWPFLIQVIYGVRSIDPVVRDTARALGVRGIRRLLTVTIPSASPYVVTGLRIASAQALILAVVAEMIGGAEGVGRSILLAQNGGVAAYPVMYAYIVLAGLLGLLLTGSFFLLERRVMSWHETQRNLRAANGAAR
jgi:ABC-type nitrate/sulfonate/bicarbonate transport system permease component